MSRCPCTCKNDTSDTLVATVSTSANLRYFQASGLSGRSLPATTSKMKLVGARRGGTNPVGVYFAGNVFVKVNRSRSCRRCPSSAEFAPSRHATRITAWQSSVITSSLPMLALPRGRWRGGWCRSHLCLFSGEPPHEFKNGFSFFHHIQLHRQPRASPSSASGFHLFVVKRPGRQWQSPSINPAAFAASSNSSRSSVFIRYPIQCSRAIGLSPTKPPENGC